MKYRGESPSKKFVRLELWETGALIVPGFMKLDTLSLASSEAGDVSVLLGLGMNACRIHTVDHDKHEAAAAKWKFPFVNNHFGDVFSYAAKHKKKFGMVFLDFCGPLRETTIDNCARLIPRIVPGGVLALGLLAGREQGIIRAGVKGLLHEYQDDSFLSRVHLVTDALHRRRLKLRLHCGWYYKSHAANSYGKPMVVMLFQMAKRRQPYVDKQMAKATLEECVFTNYDLAQKTLKLERQRKKPELLLNISRASVAAYKAWETRNSYG